MNPIIGGDHPQILTNFIVWFYHDFEIPNRKRL